MSAYIVKELLHYCNVMRKKSTAISSFESNYYDFTFVLKGRLRYKVNGQIFELHQNDAIFLPPNTIIERFEINESVKYVSYNFLAYENARLPEGPFLKGIISKQILDAVSCFSASHIAETYSTKEKAMNLLNFILHELNDILDFKSSNPHIINIIRYINEHITEPIGLACISSHIGLTKEHTAHIFKKETNMTVTQYINHRKMMIAKDMIGSTAYPLHDIAERLGYDGYSYFSRVFRKEFGISPNHFKNG